MLGGTLRVTDKVDKMADFDVARTTLKAFYLLYKYDQFSLIMLNICMFIYSQIIVSIGLG